MMQTSLAGAVRERLVGGDTQAVNAADVDYSRGIALRGGFLHHGSQELGDGKDTVEVERQDSSPRGGRVFIVGSGPIGAGVIDENMEF